ncbi:MAG: rhomboid family intramembrane serine protease [Thermodesulfobacteriota bacterium]|nr:rhomboid family intramembrane serine protease [Thermodesulfobacteriota bacterium]
MDKDALPVSAAFCRTYQQASLWSLVLSAENQRHSLEKYQGGWLILVPEEGLDHARQSIVSFEKENENWPPPKEENVGFGLFKDRHPPTVLIMGALLLFFGITGEWADQGHWFDEGAVRGRRILEHGEWWRVLTGLTLHADPVHVFSNAVIGGVVIHFLCKILGSGLGWLLVLLAGCLGNSINIVFRGEFHNSVGFSTAVFGAIGILCGIQVKRRQGIKGLLLPLGAGLSLLAMLGSEGERTDFGAHLWGLASGMLTGTVIASLPVVLRWSLSPKRQFILFVICILAVYSAWWLALRS